MVKMFARAARATFFDKKAYTETFFNDDAAADGAIIVGMVGAVSYVGFLVWNDLLRLFGIGALLQSVLAGVIAWLILAMATWFVASRMFGATGRPQMMMGMHALATLPLLLEIPRNRTLAGLGLLWYLALLVVATREATELTPRNAGVAVLIGFAVAALVRALFGVPFAIFSALT